MPLFLLGKIKEELFRASKFFHLTRMGIKIEGTNLLVDSKLNDLLKLLFVHNISFPKAYPFNHCLVP
jgi:hypothetical protein